MSKAILVESSAAEANAVQCEDCTDAVRIGKGFFDGQAAIQKHADSFPLHRKVTFLRSEIV